MPPFPSDLFTYSTYVLLFTPPTKPPFPSTSSIKYPTCNIQPASTSILETIPTSSHALPAAPPSHPQLIISIPIIPFLISSVPMLPPLAPLQQPVTTLSHHSLLPRENASVDNQPAYRVQIAQLYFTRPPPYPIRSLSSSLPTTYSSLPQVRA